MCVTTKRELVEARPDPKHVSPATSIQNLTICMSVRRFTRVTNAFSKKVENDCHALALYFVRDNSVRQHKAHRLSRAMAAGVADRLWSIEDIAELAEAAVPEPRRRGPSRKREP